MNSRKKIALITIIMVAIFFVGCSESQDIPEKPNLPMSKTTFDLGTVVTITIYDDVNENVFDKAFERIRELENKMSIDIEGTELTKVNKNSGLNYVKVSDDTFKVIESSIYYSDITKGYFDITIGPIVKLWNIGRDNARVPSQDEIDEKLDNIDYKNILLNDEEKSVMLRDKDMIIDLGAIAKGYIADEVAKLLIEKGVEHAIIDLGGNNYVLGSKPDNSKWKVGIQNPFTSRGEYFGIVQVENKSIVTSGIYERFIEKDGKRYHHILNPYTGYPIENNIMEVSIISDKSIDGDALSTSVFSLGVEEGKKLVESLDGVDAIFVTKDYEVYVTKDIIDIFTILDSKFKIINE